MTILVDQTKPSYEELLAMLVAEKHRNAELAKARSARVWCKVSDKGAMSVYGLQQFPYTFYASQWERFTEALPDIQAFFAANRDKFTTKGSK